MRHTALHKFPIWFLSVLAFIININTSNASHSEGADITYKCLGGNQYEITLSFYRDCNGVNAPTAATINFASVSTNQNFNITFQPIPGTGQEISLVCSNVLTQCQGGTYPGVQEWVYRGMVTLTPAIDWVFSFDYCCRNAAITTIVNPGGQNIHIESTLDNLNFPCNSSPVFSTKPIPFVCINQSYTFNHGASDPDADFISYELITPMNGYNNSTVTYILPNTFSQPLTSVPAMTFDTLTGDINMNPTILEVTILAVKVKQWRNGQLVGYVIRDIQLRTMTCSNSYPYINGINGNGSYVTSACVGNPMFFYVYTYDPDTSQTLTVTWNNGIPGASFTIDTTGQFPIGAFSWTPTPADIGTHCFTLTITDNNCPINGSVSYAICLVVSGVEVNVTTASANCGASNGNATAVVIGGTPPFSYQWLPCGCINNPLNGLQSGTYTAIVTDGKGCTASDTGTVAAGSAQGNITMSATPPSCTGGNNGTATANANGGQPPYSYLWSNGQTSQTITGLAPGTYFVTVTTSQGCVKLDSITITEPALLSSTVSQQDALCFGGTSGTASVFPSGGTPPYSYSWNTGQSSQNVTGLSAGTYFATVTDANGCTVIQNVFIGQPAALSVIPLSMNNLTCFGGSNGSMSVSALGGVAPYSYVWSNGQTGTTASALGAGSYTVQVTDANGCTFNASFLLGQPVPITSNMNSTDATCFGTNTGSASVTPTGGTQPYSYQWSNGQTASMASGLSAGTYSVMVTDANGCTYAGIVSVFQPLQLIATVTSVQNVLCNNGSNGSATAAPTGGTLPYTYLWNPGAAANATATGLSAGNYTCTITDANGCTTINTAAITQPDPILITVTPNDTICPGNLSIISAAAAGGTTPYTYFWQPNVGFGNAQAVNPTTTTTYTALITDANGCMNTATTTVVVYPNNISAVLNATPSICAGQSATLIASVGGTNITNYNWSHNLGSGTGPFVVSPSVTTTYTVVVTNICGVAVTSAATVLVNPIPEINLIPQVASACDRAVLHFSDTNTANTGSTYVWNFGDGGISYQANPAHSYTGSGVYTVNVTITSVHGCSASAQTHCSITIFLTPVADFTSDPPLGTSIVNPHFYFYDQSAHATVWFWDFGDGQTSSLQNPEHTYAQTGTYTVKLVTLNTGGCIDSIIKTVEVKPEFTFYVPNTFTPNGDHMNDIFNGKGMEIIEFEMTIFDRWGNLIFATHDLHKGWDGKANDGAEIAQEDVYVYKIHLRDFEKKAHSYIGHVNLVK